MEGTISATTTQTDGARQVKLELSSVRGALQALAEGIPLAAPPSRVREEGRDESVPHAPVRAPGLSELERRRAIANALRYFPPELHPSLAPEFAQELADFGHIYMYRFRPTTYSMRAYPIDFYPAKCQQGMPSRPSYRQRN
jgi:urocanate hydratase